MNIETLVESAPASPLQASPTPSCLVDHSTTADPLIDTNILAGTNVRIAPLYVKSGKVGDDECTIAITRAMRSTRAGQLGCGVDGGLGGVRVWATCERLSLY